MIKKILVIFLVIVSANVNAQSNRQRLDDIEDKLDNLILQQQINEVNRIQRENELLQRKNDDLSSKNSCINPVCYSYKRKYFNGVCKLYWKPGHGFIEISKPLAGKAVFDVVSNDKKLKLELYIEKSISIDGVSTFIELHSYEMYQMCK